MVRAQRATRFGPLNSQISGGAPPPAAPQQGAVRCIWLFYAPR
jgi:hypothetical protein